MDNKNNKLSPSNISFKFNLTDENIVDGFNFVVQPENFKTNEASSNIKIVNLKDYQHGRKRKRSSKLF